MRVQVRPPFTLRNGVFLHPMGPFGVMESTKHVPICSFPCITFFRPTLGEQLVGEYMSSAGCFPHQGIFQIFAWFTVFLIIFLFCLIFFQFSCVDCLWLLFTVHMNHHLELGWDPYYNFGYSSRWVSLSRSYIRYRCSFGSITWSLLCRGWNTQDKVWWIKLGRVSVGEL